ncbi:Lysine-specific demethylase 7B [Listeria monocytogenes N53-1]|nr:Lysine-specific demethylase 7B [Listeria monocytogenes N53-1]
MGSSHKLNQLHQNPNILTIPQTPTSHVLRGNQPIKFRQLPVCKQSRLIHLRMIHQQKFLRRFFHHMALNLILQNIRIHYPAFVILYFSKNPQFSTPTNDLVLVLNVEPITINFTLSISLAKLITSRLFVIIVISLSFGRASETASCCAGINKN